MLESCFQRLFGVIRHVEFTFQHIYGGTVCNLRFFFFSFSLAGYLAGAFEIKNRNCAKKVLCYRKTDTSVYDNFSRKYLSQISSGNVCKNCTLQYNKYIRCRYFLIIGKLVICHDILRRKEFQNSQWFARYRDLNVPYFLSPSFWYNVFDFKSF